VLIAGVLGWSRRGQPGGQGWYWFLAWSVAGFLMSFSLITGFSIGLLILPFAAAMLIWTTLRSPHPREASGFFVGIAATAVLIAALNA
jgi:hypothetical protein